MSGDKLNGCRFCLFENVQHPESGGFIRGDDGLYKTLEDICDINMNNTIPDKEMHMLEHDNCVPEPQKEREHTSEQFYDAKPYAIEAVTFYNQKRHTNYELLDQGFGTRAILPTCSLFHINFTAKNSDDALAQEEMFFAELTSAGGVLSFSLCVSMGPTDNIPEEDILRGCYFCRHSNVQHPNERFARGGDSLYKEIPEKKRDPDS